MPLLLMEDHVIKVHGRSGDVRGEHRVSVALRPGLKPLSEVSFFDTKPPTFPVLHSALHTTHMPLYDMLRHNLIYMTT